MMLRVDPDTRHTPERHGGARITSTVADVDTHMTVSDALQGHPVRRTHRWHRLPDGRARAVVVLIGKHQTALSYHIDASHPVLLYAMLRNQGIATVPRWQWWLHWQDPIAGHLNKEES